MALLKSARLLHQETEQAIQRQRADECYAILEAWQSKQPVIVPTVAVPAKTMVVDNKPFGYDFAHRPTNCKRMRRFSLS